MLRDGPAYSYQLAARIHELLGPGFDINTGQMSALTTTLRRDELIELVAETGQTERRAGSDRRIYALTPKGAEEYEDFFAHGSNEPKTFRRSLLVKMALAGPERLGEVLDQINDYEQHCTDRIGELNLRRDEVLPDEDLRPRVDRVILRLAIDADVYQLKAELAWARHAREMISWLRQSDAIWPASLASPRLAANPEQTARDEARKQLLDRLAARNRSA